MSAAKIEYTLHPLHLDEHDRQELQMNATHSPKPRIKSQLSGTFCLPTGASVLYVLLLLNASCPGSKYCSSGTFILLPVVVFCYW